MAEVAAIFTADISGYTSAMDKMGRSTTSATNGASRLGGRISSAMGTIGKVTTAAGVATTAMGVSALKSYGTFQQSLNKASIIAGGTSKDIGELSDMANRMGAELPLSAQDAADAMVSMAQDGASIKTITKEFPAIAEAATATGADLQTTAGTVQQAMNIWGKSLKSPAQAAAILTQTANLSNASIEDMSGAIANIGGVASQAKFGMGDMTESIGLLTNKGFSAQRASQDLAHAIIQMEAPSDKAAGEMKKLGLSFTDAQGNMKPFPTILKEVAAATDGMSASQKTAALKTMFNTAGMQAMLPLLDSVNDKSGNTATSWDAYAKAQDGASSSTATATKFLKDQASEMQQNIGSKIEQVGGNWESLRNKALAAKGGVNGAMIDMINKTITWSTESNSSIAQVIRSFIGLSPVIGAATVAVGGFLTSAGKIVSTMSSLGSLLVSPWGAGLIAITALVAGVIYAYNNIDSFKTSVNNLGGSLKNVFVTIGGNAVNSFKGLISALSDDFAQIGQAIKTNLGAAMGSIDFSGFASRASSAINGVIQVVILLAKDITETIVAFLNTGAVQAAWNAIKSVISTIITVAQNVISVFSDVSNSGSGFTTLGTIIGNVVKGISNLISGVSNFVNKMLSIASVSDVFKSVFVGVTAGVVAFKGVITAINLYKTAINVAKGVQIAFNAVMAINPFVLIITAIAAVVAALVYFFTQTKTGQALWKSFTAMLSSLWKTISTTAVSIWNGLGEFFANLWPNIVSTAQGAWTGLQTDLSDLWSGIVGIASGIWNGLGQFFSGLWTGITTTASNMWNSFTTTISTIWQSIITTAQTVWQPFGEFFSTLWNGIKNTATTIWTNISGYLSQTWNSIKEVAGGVWEMIKSVIAAPVLVLSDIITGQWNMIKSDLMLVWNGLKDGAAQIWNGIRDFFSNTFNSIKNTAVNVWNNVKSALVNIWNGTVNVGKSVWNGFKSAISGIWNGINSIASSVWNGIKSTVTKTVNDAVSGAKSAWNKGKAAISNIWNGMKSAASSAWNRMKSAIGNAAQGAKTLAQKSWSGLRSATSSTWSGIKSMTSSAWSSMKSIVGSAARGMVSAARSSWSGMRSAASNVVSNVKFTFQSLSWINLWSAGYAIMDSFFDGLQSAWGNVQSFVSGIAGWIRRHKGPISYDAKLLIPAGNAIMNGLNSGLMNSFSTVQSNVSGMADKLSESINSVAGDIKTGDLSMQAASYQGGSIDQNIDSDNWVQPTFIVKNELVGDKIYTTVKSKESREYDMNQFFKR